MGQGDVTRVYVVEAINVGFAVNERVLAIFDEKWIGIFTLRIDLTATDVFLRQRIARVPYSDAFVIPVHISRLIWLKR